MEEEYPPQRERQTRAELDSKTTNMMTIDLLGLVGLIVADLITGTTRLSGVTPVNNSWSAVRLG
jgi:hypothetical protein